MNKYIGIICVAVIAFAILTATSKPSVRVAPLGGSFEPYTASTSDSTVAGRSQKYKGNSNTSAGVIGAFVITGTSATAIEIMNATSSTDLSSTTIAKFAASAPAGTYQFDAAFDRGLIINYLGAYAGNATIMYK